MKDRIGIHIRLQSSIVQLLEHAELLDLAIVQYFLVRQASGTLVRVTDEEVQLFLQKKRAKHYMLICHGSYLINLASLGNNGYYFLQHEIALAKRLESTHFLLHCGIAKGAKEKNQGIDALVFSLNKLLRHERDITIIVENTAHGNLSVGSDISDFKAILEKIDKPERISFCIDTAHAHSFGYAIIEDDDQDHFISFLDNTIGLERIALLHLNDSFEQRGSRIDRHAVIGEGTIGFDALKRFALHPQCNTIPFVLELPEISLEKEKAVIETIMEWDIL